VAEFRMPALGADMTEGTVTRWRVQPGDTVKRGDIAVEIETDKAEMEVEIFEAGVIESILVPEGQKVPVGTPLAMVATRTAGGVPPATVPAEVPRRAPEPAVTPPSAPVIPGPVREPVAAPVPTRVTPAASALARQLGIDIAAIVGTGVGGSITRRDVERAASPARTLAEHGRRAVLASPRVRRLASERGIDLSSVTGTGPAGAITVSDLLATAPAPRPAPAPTPPEGAPRVRRFNRGPLAALMSRSNAEIPHYFLSLDIDITKTLEWLEAGNRSRTMDDRVLPAAVLLRAVTLATGDVPEVNGHWVEGEFRPADAVHLGVAIALRGGGLVSPAILEAQTRSLQELMRDLRDLVLRARLGRLRASEMSMGTITVTNLGEQGVDAVQGVIYPPQVALVGFGRIGERPWAEHGMLAVRRVVTATLAGDHRASDGHRGGLFLSAVARYLQDPEKL